MNPLSWWKTLRDQRAEEDLAFMDEFEAALHRKPLIGPRILTAGTAVLIALFLLWAAWAELDEVTRGQGQVIPSQRIQTIQNLEGGILDALLVRENQIVDKDALLARLNNESAQSIYQDAVGKSLEHRLAIIRLEALLKGTSPDFPADLRAQAPQIVADQQQLYETAIRRQRSENEVLRSQVEQRLQDVEEQQKRRHQVEQNLALSKEQLDIVKGLSERQLYSRVEYLNLQQKVNTLQGDLAALNASIPKAEDAAREAQEKKLQRLAEMESLIAEEINKRRTELASLQQSISAGGDRVSRTELRSPVRGVVKRIFLNTLGGVVRPGEAIMEVVPLDDSLLVEVRIRPADIAFIHPGQPATVKISAYDFSTYGGLKGVVEEISADTIEDRRGESFYLAKVRTNENAITYRNRSLPIIPGMICTADILTGKKTVLSFLLKPILKAQENALHER